MQDQDMIHTIREIGISLGKPNMRVPAKVELAFLRRKTPESRRLVAVYGGGDLGFSASPLDNANTWRICRRAVTMGMECTVYAVPNSFIKG